MILGNFKKQIEEIENIYGSQMEIALSTCKGVGDFVIRPHNKPDGMLIMVIEEEEA